MIISPRDKIPGTFFIMFQQFPTFGLLAGTISHFLNVISVPFVTQGLHFSGKLLQILIRTAFIFFG